LKGGLEGMWAELLCQRRRPLEQQRLIGGRTPLTSLVMGLRRFRLQLRLKAELVDR